MKASVGPTDRRFTSHESDQARGWNYLMYTKLCVRNVFPCAVVQSRKLMPPYAVEKYYERLPIGYMYCQFAVPISYQELATLVLTRVEFRQLNHSGSPPMGPNAVLSRAGRAAG